MEEVIETPELEETPKAEEQKKKNSAWKFLIYILIILVLTGLALFLSLYQDFYGVINTLSNAKLSYIFITIGLVLLSYLLEGLIIFIFVRLYTRNYHWPHGIATAIVGCFYSNVTPGASGGQPMEIYTMKKQGVEVSNAASIMIMNFIIYQVALITVGVVGLIFKWDLVLTIGEFVIPIGENTLRIPAIPFTIAGFVLNLSVILLLFVMSFSHKFHNFIMHYGIDFLAKLRILKKPEETRESLRIQVENFKIELKRLSSNIPVTILIFIINLLILMIRFSIPFWAGLALNGFEGYLVDAHGMLVIVNGFPVKPTGSATVASFFDTIFLTSFHQMVSGLIPIPGAAGISEYFFSVIFSNYFVSQQIGSAAQIIWRFTTYHFMLLLSGIFVASYHVSPRESGHHADRKTFVTIQYETYELRKASADTMYETASLSRKEVQERLKSWNKKAQDDAKKRREARLKKNEEKVEEPIDTSKPKKTNRKSKSKKTSDDDFGWDEINIGD